MSITNNYNTETQKQLSFLGYKKGDTVYLRGFLPANHPDKNKDKGRKSTCKSFTQLKNIADEWEQQGLGVYLVVNGGGHTDNDVKECRALFYEHDNLAKELQIDLWQSLNLPVPTFQIDTGGKSIHSYWVLSEKISPEDWRKIQSDLLECADADRALKNPSRVMRLAGYAHSSGQKSTIISESGKLYSYEELRKIIPIHKVKQPTIPIAHDISDWGDMRKIATYLDGYKVGGRQGWITCKCPVHNGQSSDSLHINENSGQFHCHAGCDTKEIFKVSLDIAKSRGYIVPETETVYTPINTTTKKVKPEISKSDLITELNQLIDKELPKSSLEVLFPEIAERSGRSSSEIRRIYDALVKEKSLEFDRLEVKNQIPEILKAQQARLKPQELFWGDGGKFAELLQKVADAMPTCVENLITTLIPVAGSRIGTAARIVINPAGKYVQPAIFWSCVVAPTGRLKTPAQEVIISPLAKLEAEEFRKWQIAKNDFDEELKRYKKNADNDPPEQPLPRKRFLVQGATAETRIKLHSENTRGLLNYRDEWSSFINGRNKYRAGKGDDLELDLSEFNGSAILKDSSSEQLFLERSAISRTGNTQPETLSKFLAAQNFEDYTGEFARWLFCLVPGDVAFLELFKQHDESGEILENHLTGLYRSLGRIEEKDYFLTNGAKGVFQGYHRYLTDLEINETHPGLRASYPKLKSYLARIALLLHIVNSVLAGEATPPQMVEGTTMYQACKVVDFYFQQSKLLYNSFGSATSQEFHLTEELLKIKEYLQKHPEGRTLREIKSGIYSLRKCSTPDIERNCATLCDLKIIHIENKKYFSLEKNHQQHQQNSENLTQCRVEGVDQPSTNINKHQQISENLEFSSTELSNSTVHNRHSVVENEKIKSVDGVDDLLIPDQHPQHLTVQEFRESVDVVDDFSEESKNNFSTTDIEVIPLEANTVLLRSFLGDDSVTWPMILELTDQWTMKWGEEYKKQVFKMLSKAEQDKYREMKREYEKSGVSSQESGVRSQESPITNHQSPISNEQLKTEKSPKKKTISKGDKFTPIGGPHAGKKFLVTSIYNGTIYGKTDNMISPKPFPPQAIKLVEA